LVKGSLFSFELSNVFQLTHANVNCFDGSLWETSDNF